MQHAFKLVYRILILITFLPGVMHAQNAPAENAGTFINSAIERENHGDYKTAVDYCNKAIAAEPQNAQAYVVRGLAWYGMERYKDAIADYDKGIQLIPGNPFYYLSRGDANKRLKQYQKAPYRIV